jgi:hypothetical protein
MVWAEGTDLRGRLGAIVEITRTDQDEEAVVGEILGDLEPDAAVGAADESDGGGM